jgi:hypothetical protein
MDLFDTFIFGNMSWLYFVIFLGLGFGISTKVKIFNLIMMVACVFQTIIYLNYYAGVPLSINWIWQPVIMLLCVPIFLLRLAGVNWFS